MALTSSATDESTAELQSKMAPAVAEPVVRFLRLEGLALTAISAVLYVRTGSSWSLFAALWLVPDLSMLGYLVSPCWGARSYNAIHTTITPITLALAALLFHTAGPLPYALIWLNHIGVDRLLGYGLKYPAGFGWTHLGGQGKQRGESTLAPSSLS